MTFTAEQLKSDEAIELKRQDMSKLSKVPVTSDEYLYEISEIKAKLNAQLTTAIKESAFDCYLYSNVPGTKGSEGKGVQCMNFGDPSKEKFSYVPNFADQQNDVTLRTNKRKIEWEGYPIRIGDKEYVYRRMSKDVMNIYDLGSYEEALKGEGVQPVQVGTLEINEKGENNLEQLEELLKNNPKSLVSLMQGNNEIGNLNDLEQIGSLARVHGAFFHSDTVQTMGHYAHDLSTLPVDALVAAAHKFHGPKGVGFLYVRKDKKIHPLIHGGSQERNMRGGTENVIGIIGLAKALEISLESLAAHRTHIEKIKSYFIEKLKQDVSDVSFNGCSADLEKSLYTVLNVSLPPSESNRGMLLFHLDLEGISASGGSACSSGATVGSHVLRALQHSPERDAVRFSFSRFTTMEEVDYTVEKLKVLYS
jgi:cysteine sulfinate desulfinase/cysteine desulfurase-like protein